MIVGNCRHHNSDNPYGIDYCKVHDTRYTFAHDDCDKFEPDTNNADTSDITHQAHRTTIVKTAILLAVIITCLLMAILSSCTSMKYVPVPEVHEHWHHSTDTTHKTDSVIDRRRRPSGEVDSTTMEQYGIQIMTVNAGAWLIQTDRLQRELSELGKPAPIPSTSCDRPCAPTPSRNKYPHNLSPGGGSRRLHLANILLFGLLIGVIILDWQKIP